MWIAAIFGILFGLATFYEFVTEFYWGIVARANKQTGHLFKKHFLRGIIIEVFMMFISLWVVVDCFRYLTS